jgi:hypothetical protein
LITTYTAAISSRAESPQVAATLIALLASPDTAEVRRAVGFD